MESSTSFPSKPDTYVVFHENAFYGRASFIHQREKLMPKRRWTWMAGSLLYISFLPSSSFDSSNVEITSFVEISILLRALKFAEVKRVRVATWNEPKTGSIGIRDPGKTQSVQIGNLFLSSIYFPICMCRVESLLISIIRLARSSIYVEIDRCLDTNIWNRFYDNGNAVELKQWYLRRITI